MNALHPASAGSSEMGDLDGFNIPSEYSYNMQPQYATGNEDFGFDPPQFTKAESYSPPIMSDPLQLTSWTGFDGNVSKDVLLANQLHSPEKSIPSFQLERMLNQSLPDSSMAVSRFGQVTPPRSNSASSEEHGKSAEVQSPKSNPVERRKRNSKATAKEEPELPQPATTGRKRKNSRKSSAVKEEQDDKRKQSLEKNRLAAAKCRINKKEKTEILQRNSHEKAVHNAFLKEQVMRMKEEVQQMNALLLAHANCEGCKSPDEIQKHLSNLGNEFFAHHMSSLNYEYPPSSLDEMSRLGQDTMMQSDLFGSNPGSTMLNPPLPEFDRAAEFEVHTPMQTD